VPGVTLKKPPAEKAQPQHSGRIDLPYPHAVGVISVRLALGRSIDDVLARRGLTGPAFRSFEPPFNPLEIAVGMDRHYRVRVPVGLEKQLVASLAVFREDFDGVFVVWTPPVRVSRAPNDLGAWSDPNYYLNWIGMQQAWDWTISAHVGPGQVRIAVLDTGLRSDHEDMGWCGSPGGSQCGKQLPGWDYQEVRVGGQSWLAGGASDNGCLNGHGTQVTSIAAANTDNGLGYAGTGWNSGIIPIRVLGPACEGEGAWMPQNAGGGPDRGGPIRKAVELGAHVINMSYDQVGYDADEAAALEYAWNAGTTPIVGAGNEGIDLDATPHYPCSALYVICIGGVQSSDGARWPGSNYAGTANYRVDFTAPSVGICGAVSDGDPSAVPPRPHYRCGTGTSYAAPIVAGVAALLKSCGKGPQQQYDALVATARGAWLDSSIGKYTSQFGLINAGQAVANACQAPPPPTACTSATLATNPASPVERGTIVTLIASANGCATPYFRFWIAQNGSSWTLRRDWSTSATYAWDTATGAPDYWHWWVEASASPPTDAKWATLYWFAVQDRCDTATLVASPASPQPRGVVVTFTATSTGCASPRYLFWMWNGSVWTVMQDYSSANQYVWNTAGLQARTYSWLVYVKGDDAGGAVASSNWIDYGLQDPCASVSATVSPPSPQLRGTLVTMSASSTGCQSPQYLYLRQASGSTQWVIARDYSSDPNYTWDTSTTGATVFTWAVYARGDTAGGNIPGYLFDYYVTEPCSAVTLSASPVSPATRGTSVTFSASATGCQFPQYRFELVDPSSSWRLMRDWSSSSSFVWDTATETLDGTYTWRVFARGDTAGGALVDDMEQYVLEVSCASAKLTATPPTPSSRGTSVTWDGVVSGCPTPELKFWMHNGIEWLVMQEWGASTRYIWDTTTWGPRTFAWVLWGRAGPSDPNTVSYWYDYTVLDPCTSTSSSASPASPQDRGTAVTFTATASSCGTPEYRFERYDGATWQVMRDWSTASQYAWDTSSWSGSVYSWRLLARGDALGSTPASYSFSYEIRDPCATASLSASPASPQKRGTLITLTAGSTGCLAPQYQFWVWDGQWRLMRDFSSSNQYAWNSTGWLAQTYTWFIYARGGTVNGTLASAQISYTLRK
jgi:hypothetical protein